MIERLDPPSRPLQAVTGGYPAFFNALVGGNASDCARVRPNALKQARLFSDSHYADDRGRAALAAFQSQYPDVNMTACVAPGVAAEDLTWAKARCWQMVYGSLSGALGAAATPDDEAVVARLLSSVGLALTVEEKLVDAATGLSGCGPAYVLLAIEALADGGVREGLPRDAAIALAAHTVAGAARMVTDLPEGGRVPRHPALLREAVCSPGGATIVGLAELEDAGVRGALARAVGAAARRARELAGE